jgi:hypothetical protein
MIPSNENILLSMFNILWLVLFKLSKCYKVLGLRTLTDIECLKYSLKLVK